ncbi:hypothetical protein LRS74_24110 [Streptomyces sp. LX-29]|uniref:hypothetical protein n=1 Tax=Streptomyces sp. LX-29 TaxID=2900152 RepID=UPI00240E50A5|nr:hypothetical protein [Streptomyces sp. LX-29]WFB09786.1 hypothetical protein LRS74_24110 [Streptomyces sp. LX-29]
MFPSSLAPDAVRPATEAVCSDAEHANEEIRAFLRARRARPLLPEERVEYTRLLGLYLRAVRREMALTAAA